MCFVVRHPFCRGQMYLQQKTKHEFCLIMSYWVKVYGGGLIKKLRIGPGGCGLFPVGPTFEDHPQVFSPKKTTCALDLFKSTFFVGEAEHMYFESFLQGANCIFSSTRIPWWHIFTCNHFCNFWPGAPGTKWAVRAGDCYLSQKNKH